MTNHLLTTSSFYSESMYFLFFIVAWGISYLSFPVIINVSKAKGLFAMPSDRSSHTTETPNLGGVGIFIGFVSAYTFFGSLFNTDNKYNIGGLLLILFFLGLKDDILILSAKTKLVVQCAVSLLLTLNSNITIHNFYGIFGIYEIDSIPAIALTTFVYVLIINSYNLIDGIDGLAGIIAICFFCFSSILFYNADVIPLIIVSLTLMGSLIAFLQYNFSKKMKIFMGDTGSMIVGFLLSFVLINLLNLKQLNFGLFSYPTNPVLFIALLFYPLLDTARIFFVRLVIFKKSPFNADKNHIHHKLLSLGFKHYQISVLVGVVTLVLASFSILMVKQTIYVQLFSIIFMGTILFSLPLIIDKMKSISFNFMKDSILLILVSITFLQSCALKKDVLYFNDKSSGTISDTKIANQKMEPNDILSIKIYSLDPESSKSYNIDLLENNLNSNGLDVIKLKSYLVTDDGEVIMPILGSIKVNNKTTAELESFLKNKLISEGHLKDPTVTVRILNAKITVLGEVRSPGTFTFAEKNLTILQALGLAGDLTINGERKDILLIRQENNTKTIHHINLTSKEWMSSELFYVKQNDVIVVNPNNAKIKSSGIIGNAGTVISLISLFLTGFLLIKN